MRVYLGPNLGLRHLRIDKMFRFALGFLIVSLSTMPSLAAVKSASSYGYRGQDVQTYDRLVNKFSKWKCSKVEKNVASAEKLMGKDAKGTGIQVAAGVANANGTTKSGLLAQVAGNVAKDAALRRDAGNAVLRANTCK